MGVGMLHRVDSIYLFPVGFEKYAHVTIVSAPTQGGYARPKATVILRRGQASRTATDDASSSLQLSPVYYFAFQIETYGEVTSHCVISQIPSCIFPRESLGRCVLTFLSFLF